MLRKLKLFVLILCSMAIIGCAKDDLETNSLLASNDVIIEYTNEISKYTDNDDKIFIDNGVVSYKYDINNDRYIHMKPYELDSYDDMKENVEKNVKLSVASAFNINVTDEIISIASNIENSDEINGILVQIAKFDGKYKPGDSSDDSVASLDLSNINLDNMHLEDVAHINNAILNIKVNTNMSKDDFMKFAKDLKESIISKYSNERSFPFSISSFWFSMFGCMTFSIAQNQRPCVILNAYMKTFAYNYVSKIDIAQ